MLRYALVVYTSMKAGPKQAGRLKKLRNLIVLKSCAGLLWQSSEGVRLRAQFNQIVATFSRLAKFLVGPDHRKTCDRHTVD